MTAAGTGQVGRARAAGWWPCSAVGAGMAPLAGLPALGRGVPGVPGVLGPGHDAATAVAPHPLGEPGPDRVAQRLVGGGGPERDPHGVSRQEEDQGNRRLRMPADHGAPAPDPLPCGGPSAPDGSGRGRCGRAAGPGPPRLGGVETILGMRGTGSASIAAAADRSARRSPGPGGGRSGPSVGRAPAGADSVLIENDVAFHGRFRDLTLRRSCAGGPGRRLVAWRSARAPGPLPLRPFGSVQPRPAGEGADEVDRTTEG